MPPCANLRIDQRSDEIIWHYKAKSVDNLVRILPYEQKKSKS